MKKLKIILKYKYFIILILFLAYSFIKINVSSISKFSNENNITGYIDKYIIDGNKLSITLISKEKILCNYYFKNIEELNNFKLNYKLGDYLYIEGIIEVPKSNTIFNLFNYKEYLKCEGINYIFNISSYKLISNNNNILYKIKNKISDKIENNLNREYLYAFILGNTKYIDSEVLNSYRTNGISHLFAISGMHISIISLIILKIFRNIKYKELIVNVFILFYVLLTFSPSIIRSGIFFILLSINKYFKLNISNINLMIILLCICILIDPFIITKIGFLYSYIISFTLIIFNDLIRNSKYKLLSVSFIAFVVSIPITINNFFEINLLSIIYNLFFVPLISTLIFPLSLLTFILPIFSNLLYISIKVLELISLFLSNIKLLIIPLSKLNVFGIIVYYIVIYYILFNFKNHNYKSIILLFIVMLLHFNINIFNNNMKVTYIDVGEGDSSLIMMPNNKLNILIDTGGSINYYSEWKIRNNNYSLGNDIVKYMKSVGIHKLDYLILTHGDVDHIGNALDIVNNINIDNVIFNRGIYNYKELEIIEVLKNKSIKYTNDVGKINNIYFLNNKIYENENDNSIVIYFNIDNFKFLFMGDASIKIERDIINKYNIGNIDFLKVGHHGSDTSSSEYFINKIKPNNCVISVGEHNKYNHPKVSVLNILDKCNIYRTDMNGSILISLNKNKYKIKTIKE